MLTQDNRIWIAQTDPQLSHTEGKENVYMLPKMANRHGLIAGATGTGKTITMKVLAESFSDMGVPVFFADVKGDLTGTAFPGVDNENMQGRIQKFGLSDCFSYKGYPCRFWDIYGEVGHPVRVTVSSLGPVLLSRLLGLSDVQEGVLNVLFKIADENGLLLLDLKDLRSMLSYVGENAKEFTLSYGMVSPASVGAIQRALLAFENEGGELFFGEPELNITDLIRTDMNGKGYINILESSKLVQNPLTYSTFLLWMLTELYETLPEVGDLEKPRLVFFFDEAHMLFTDAPKVLVQKIEQVVKLIRSKGVGVYFVTQNPSDIPDGVLAQLNNKVLHGLRAYTPAEQKKVKSAAESFRANDKFKTDDKIMELGTGEALVSFLDEKGIPQVVQAVKILPPQSLMGAGDATLVQQNILSDEFDLKYRQTIDRESAYEVLEQARAQMLIDIAEAEEAAALEKEAEAAAKAEAKAIAKEEAAAAKAAEKEAAAAAKAAEKEAAAAAKAAAKAKAAKVKTVERAASNAASSVARSVSTNVVNALTGGKTKSAGQIATQAAKTALSSVMRTGATSIVRGLFGNSK